MARYTIDAHLPAPGHRAVMAIRGLSVDGGFGVGPGRHAARIQSVWCRKWGGGHPN